MASEQMQKAFLANPDSKRFQRKVAAEPKKPGGIDRKSHAQDVRQAYLAGIRDERLRWDGCCDRCKQPFTAQPDIAHSLRRTRGRRYKPGAPGIDAPDNIRLLDRFCHEAEHT